jgi:hypothetical protein
MLLPRFSLRTMLVAVTVACVALSWTGYQLNWIRERRKALARNQYYEVLHSRVRDILANWPSAPWTIRIFGEKGVYELVVFPEVTDSELERLKHLFPEADVRRPEQPGPDIPSSKP